MYSQKIGVRKLQSVKRGRTVRHFVIFLCVKRLKIPSVREETNASSAITGVNRRRGCDGVIIAFSDTAGTELNLQHICCERLSHDPAAVLCRLSQRSNPVRGAQS